VRSNFLPPSAYRLRFYRAQSLSCPEIAVLCGVAHGAGGCEREQGLIPDSNFDFEEEETGMGTVPEEGTAKQRKIETGEGGGGGGGGGRRPAAEYPPMQRARTAPAVVDDPAARGIHYLSYSTTGSVCLRYTDT
jgi:hypothetical protein